MREALAGELEFGHRCMLPSAMVVNTTTFATHGPGPYAKVVPPRTRLLLLFLGDATEPIVKTLAAGAKFSARHFVGRRYRT